jgi:transposase
MEQNYISQESWSKIFLFLKTIKNIYIMNENKCRKFIESVFWIVRTGAQWRNLDSKFGNWNTVFKRFNEWSKKGIWKKLLKFSQKDPDLEYIMLDATIIRAHPCAAGYANEYKNQGLGRSKGGFTTKIHVKVDALGNLLDFVVTGGQVSEYTQAEDLLQGVANSYVLSDKGYDSDHMREFLEKQNCEAVMPPRKNRKKLYKYDKHIYKERYLVEFFFRKLSIIDVFFLVLRNRLEVMNHLYAL